MTSKRIKALINAIKQKSEKKIKEIIYKGVKINCKLGKSLLLYSLEYNNSENIIKLLIRKGADIYKKDKNGYSSFMYSLIGKQPLSVVKLFIE